MSEPRLAAMQLMAGAIVSAQWGDYEKALQMLDYAIRIIPDDGELYHNRGMVYSRIKQYDKALSDFSRALALSPHSGSFEQRGYVYKQLGDTEAARLDWEQALVLDPTSAMALTNLGHLLSEQGDYEQALHYLDRAIESEPTIAQAYATRAEVYMLMKLPTKAFADMQKANWLIEHEQDTSDQDVHY